MLEKMKICFKHFIRPKICGPKSRTVLKVLRKNKNFYTLQKCFECLFYFHRNQKLVI